MKAGAPKRRVAIEIVLGLPMLALLGAAVLYPLITLLGAGLRTVLPPMERPDSYFLYVVVFTYGQAAASTLLSAAVGIAGALLYSEQRFVGRSLMWGMSLVGFSLPPILAVIAFTGFYGNSGWLHTASKLIGHPLPDFAWLGWTAILCAHVFFNYPLFLRNVGLALLELDRTPERTALSLGASRLYCFFRLTLPRLLPALKGAFFLSFLYCSTSFIIVLMLGGGPRFSTLEVEIYNAIRAGFDPELAARLALVQIVISVGIYCCLAGDARNEPGTRPAIFFPLYLTRKPWLDRALRLMYGTCLLCLVWGPLAALVGKGIAGGRAAWTGVAHPALMSLETAAAAAFFSSIIAFCAAYLERHAGPKWLRRLPPFLCSLPIAISSILLSLAWMRAFPDLYWTLRGNLLAVAFLQSLIILPLVYRPLREGLARIPREAESVAASLGLGQWQRLWAVELPWIRRALALGGLYGFALSLGEIGIVLLLLSEGISTLPLFIYLRMGQYRFDEAYAAGLLLLILSGAAVAILGRGMEKADHES